MLRDHWHMSPRACHMVHQSTSVLVPLSWMGLHKGLQGHGERSLELNSNALSPKPARPQDRALSWSVSFFGCRVPCWWNEVTILARFSSKESTCNAEGDTRDMGLIPGSGRSPGGGHSDLLQYSCLQIALDRGAWWATVHRVAKSQTPLKGLSTHMHPGLTYVTRLAWTPREMVCETALTPKSVHILLPRLWARLN